MRTFHHRISRATGKRLMDATVAYDYDNKTGTLSWAAAFANTTADGDDFSKKEGNRIAVTRLSMVDDNSQAPVVKTTLRPFLPYGAVQKHIERRLGGYRKVIGLSAEEYETLLSDVDSFCKALRHRRV